MRTNAPLLISYLRRWHILPHSSFYWQNAYLQHVKLI